MRGYYTLMVEPAGGLYQQLLDLAGTECQYALLVVRHTADLNQTGEQVLEQLAPYLIDSQESAEWPGTILLRHTALVLKYSLAEKSISILKEAAGRLYEWQQPLLPEDLCFLRQDDSTWLGSISHEEDSFLLLSEQEYIQVVEQIPVLASILVKDRTDT